MTYAAVDSLADQAVLFPDVQRNGPVRPEIGMGSMEQPESHDEADHSGREGPRTKRVPREGKDRRRHPYQRREESQPGKNEDHNLEASPPALRNPDPTASLTVWRTDGDHHDAGSQCERLREPGT